MAATRTVTLRASASPFGPLNVTSYAWQFSAPAADAYAAASVFTLTVGAASISSASSAGPTSIFVTESGVEAAASFAPSDFVAFAATLRLFANGIEVGAAKGCGWTGWGGAGDAWALECSTDRASICAAQSITLGLECRHGGAQRRW